MSILDAVSVELTCAACGGRYQISLEKVLLSEHMLHDGCPVPMEYTTECPPLNYAHLIDHNLIHELRRTWLCLEENAELTGGQLVLRAIQSGEARERAEGQ